MIKKTIDFISLRNVLIMASISLLLMSGLLFLQLRQSEIRLSEALNERATEAAQRIALSVSNTVWEVYQGSEDRRYSDENASKILDSELLAEFVLSAQVYGNFGHLLMARIKNEQGEIHTETSIQALDQDMKTNFKVRLPIHSGSMTIGHIVVVFTDKFHRQILLRDNRVTILIYSIFESLLLLSLYLLFRVSREQIKTNRANGELVETQNQLIQQEKLASLGNLVAGLAHEVNTPLGVAITATSHISSIAHKTRIKVDDNTLSKSLLFEHLEDMELAASMTSKNLSRVVELLKNFKEIATDQHVEDVRVIDIVHYTEDILSTLSIELRKNKVTFAVKANEPVETETFPGVVAQVITNIVMNTIHHGYENKQGGHIDIDIVYEPEPDHVTLKIQDYGKGMPPEVINRIFEPFFTTKRGKGGTGLGLHIVFNLVHQKLKGNLEVFSTLGEGTQTVLTLPLKLPDINKDDEDSDLPIEPD